MATKIFARLQRVEGARALSRALLASTLLASAALAQAGPGDYVYAPGYTGYDAAIGELGGGGDTPTVRLINNGKEPLPKGTELRIQYYSNVDPVAALGYASVAVNSIDQTLSCPGITLNQSLPGPSAPGAGLLLDMRCSLTSELDPGQSVQVQTTLGFTGCFVDPRSSTRPASWLGRTSVALPNGYVDEQPDNDTALIPWYSRPLRPCRPS